MILNQSTKLIALISILVWSSWPQSVSEVPVAWSFPGVLVPSSSSPLVASAPSPSLHESAQGFLEEVLDRNNWDKVVDYSSIILSLYFGENYAGIIGIFSHLNGNNRLYCKALVHVRCCTVYIVSFPDPTNPSTDRFQYRVWGRRIWWLLSSFMLEWNVQLRYLVRINEDISISLKV